MHKIYMSIYLTFTTRLILPSFEKLIFIDIQQEVFLLLLDRNKTKDHLI